MSSCLVTTLKGAVDDDTLPYMGDVDLEIISTSDITGDDQSKYASLSFACSKPFKVIAHGGKAYKVSGAALVGDGATELSYPAGEASVPVAFDNNVTSLTIRGGYSLTSIGTGRYISVPRIVNLTNRALRYQKVTVVRFEPSRGAGYSDDVREFIAQHPELLSFSYVSVVTKNLVPVSTFASLKNLVLLRLSTQNISGSVDELQVMPSLKTLDVGYVQNGQLGGDLAKLPPNLQSFDSYGNTSTFTWSSRSSDSWPIAFNKTTLGTYIDKALTDMAACTKNSPLTTAEKVISLIGTRTSASDAAVATLQAKGWTITVTEA